jgi:hypothetical protein
MKTNLLLIIAALLVSGTSHLQAQQTIHSTTNGGLWTDNTTWIEAVPSMGDSVVIQGPVSMLSYTGYCTTLNIVSTGSLGGNGNQGSLYIGGSIHNNGAILGAINYVLSGNIFNYQPWSGTSSNIRFIGQNHTITCSPGASINAQFIANDSLQNLTMLSDLVLNTTEASVLGFSQLETSGHKLTIASGEFSNCRLHSTDTIEINSNVSYLEITGDYKLKGSMTFYNNVVLNGKATNVGNIHFASGIGGDPLKLKGDFINKGILSHSWVQVEKNIFNEGSWIGERTEFTGTGNKHISQTTGHPFGGTQILSDNSGSVIYLDTDVEFTTPQVFLNNNTLNCLNHNLTANSTFYNGTIHSESEMAGNNDFWNSTFTGDFKLTGNNRFSNCTVNGIFTNTGLLKDITFYGGIFNSYQHLINQNSIQSLHMRIFGNLTNYGTIDNNSIVDISGNIKQYINITQSIQSPVNFYSDITGASYQWMKDGQDILNAAGQYLYFANLQLSDAGVYKCRVTDGSGNTNYSREIVVNNVTSVSENKLLHDLNVFPNPFLDHASLKWDQKVTGHIRIDFFDENGKWLKEIANSVFPAGCNQIDISDVSLFNPGIYFLRLRVGDELSTTRIVHLN